jgi:hypothetical protein
MVDNICVAVHFTALAATVGAIEAGGSLKQNS